MGKTADVVAPEWETAELGTLWVVSGGDTENAICTVIADPADRNAVAFELAGSGGAYVQARGVTQATRLTIVDAEWPVRVARISAENIDMTSRLGQIVAMCAGARTSEVLTAAQLLDALEPLLESTLKPAAPTSD